MTFLRFQQDFAWRCAYPDRSDVPSNFLPKGRNIFWKNPLFEVTDELLPTVNQSGYQVLNLFLYRLSRRGSQSLEFLFRSLQALAECARSM